MKTKKREFRFFSIMDYEKEADYLRNRHKVGWKFKNVIFPGIYSFEKCNPKDVVYQLDYNPEGIKNQEEYVQMFEDCGWEYLLNFAGYTYFRKPAALMKKEENIFCDDLSRLDLLSRIFRGRIIPLIVIFVCLLVNVYMLMDNFRLKIVFGILIIVYLLLFFQFTIKYFSFRNRIINR